MGIDILGTSGGVITVRMTGELKKAEFDLIQSMAPEAIKRWGKIRVLLIVEDFQGWERGANWGDTSFIQTHGHEIEKIAAVGDEAWRDSFYAFMGKGFRSTAIEYFTPTERDKAEAWLGVA